jgi:peptidoglycan/LPS O-acetylase OafA/YrhL
MTEGSAQPVVAPLVVAQPVVAPPPGHPRFALVDSLRAIAAISVLLTHTGFATSAITNPTYGAYVGRLNVGVTVFFVISGFLLYRPFAAHRLLSAPATRVRDYARRRLLRIVPAYWLALTVLAIFPGLPGVFTNHWWIYYGFLQVYNDGTILKGIGPAWTLCVEITFYAFLPVYAVALARCLRRAGLRRQVQAELVLLAVISVAAVWYRYWLTVHAPISPMLFALPTQIDWFAAGMALAVLSVASQATIRPWPAMRIVTRRPVLPWAVAAAAFWAVSKLVTGPHQIDLFGHEALIFTPGEDLAQHILYTVVGAALVVPAVFGADGGGRVRSILADRRLAWLGLISYGIYLWQSPLLEWVCQPSGTDIVTRCRFHGAGLFQSFPFLSLTLLSAVIVIACAATSYYLLERPLLRLKYRRSPPAPPRELATADG